MTQDESKQLPVQGAAQSAPLPFEHLQGRVFDRLERFRLLPPELKLASDAAITFLLDPSVFSSVFDMPSPPAWLSIGRVSRLPRVKSAKLLVALRWHLERSQQSTSQSASRQDAQLLADTLVLAGFLSLQNEPTRNEHELARYVCDYPLQTLELVAPGTASMRSTPATKGLSVWDVTDGATRAGFVFRKPAMPRWKQVLCFPMPREKRVYAVVNATRLQSLVLFRDDLARTHLTLVPLRDAVVQLGPLSTSRRTPLLYHGLQLKYKANDDGYERSEMFDFVTQAEQSQWMLALLGAGATYHEVHPECETWTSASAIFQALAAAVRRVADDGSVSYERMDFASLDDRVVLIVNVPSNTVENVGNVENPLKSDDSDLVDSATYLHELVALADRFGSRGLELLIASSAQFVGTAKTTTLSPSNRQEIATTPFVQVLAPTDVNGPKAHPLFLFLNSRLPSPHGPCVDGNFCGFLVDQRGVPVQRFSPWTLPSAMAAAIEQLLDADSDFVTV